MHGIQDHAVIDSSLTFSDKLLRTKFILFSLKHSRSYWPRLIRICIVTFLKKTNACSNPKLYYYNSKSYAHRFYWGGLFIFFWQTKRIMDKNKIPLYNWTYSLCIFKETLTHIFSTQKIPFFYSFDIFSQWSLGFCSICKTFFRTTKILLKCHNKLTTFTFYFE